MLFQKLKQRLLKAYMSSLSKPKVEGRTLFDLSRVKSIGLWQFGGVGDMLLITPVIDALAVACPQAKIHLWCSEPAFAEFLSGFPNVEAIHKLNIYDFDARTLASAEKRRELCQLRDEVQGLKLDLLINLHIPALIDWWAVSWWLISRSGSRFSIGFDPEVMQSESVYDVSLPASERDGVHYLSLYQTLLSRVGVSSGVTTRFPVSDESREKAQALLKSVGVSDVQAWVCLHAGARRLAMIGKQWPAASFAKLATELQTMGIRTLLIGVDSEQSLADEIRRLAPGTLSLLGQTDLIVMAAVIARARLFIGQDSGPFHVAVAQGVPSIALCGREDAEAHYLAYDRKNVHALIRPDPTQISVIDVMQQALPYLPASKREEP